MRTIVNNVISNDNLEPKIDMEYIYNFNMVWKDTPEEINKQIDVKKGIIVENVQQLENGRYQFTIKNKPDVYTCSYGWAFIENTSKNKELLRLIEEEEKVIQHQKVKITNLRGKLDCLFKWENVDSDTETE